MIAIVHLLVVFVLIKAFHLDRVEALVALLFGVFIDIDHIFGMVDFIKVQGFTGAFDLNAALSSDIQWKSLLHSPIAATIIAPISIGFRMAVPILAWGLHLMMDYVQTEYLGVLSVTEMTLMVGLIIALLALEKRELASDGRKTHLCRCGAQPAPPRRGR